MSEGSGIPPPGKPPAGKRTAIGLQIRLPCASIAELKGRYADDLRRGSFFIRTKSPRPDGTLIRLDAQLSSGELAFRAVGVVTGETEGGMRLQFLGADEVGRRLIAELGGKPPPALKTEAPHPPAPAPAAKPVRPEEPKRPPPVMSQAEPKPAAPQAAALPAQKPAQSGASGPMIGIDLGTTNSAAAVVRDGKPFVIPSREGYNTIPSIVAATDKGKLIVGHPAKGQLLINPVNTVYGAKRLIGRQFDSPIVHDLIGRFPYRIVPGASGEAAVQLGDQQYSLQQISALVLTEVKSIAEQWLKTPVTRAVITVPAYYNDNQRQAVREAGDLAGLHVERIVNEPTAAALAFGHGRQLRQRVLVYDLGGGTFDASILELNENVYEVVSSGGDNFLGGVDFDKQIVDHLLRVFRERNGVDFPPDRVALQRVTDAAERAKIALSEQLETKINVPFVALIDDKPYDLNATLLRAELVSLTGDLVDRTLTVCSEILAARGFGPSDIDEVLLVGGQSRMPLVRERIRHRFTREPSKAVHPDEAVALGAALLAHSMDSPDTGSVVLIDVLPMSIGVGLPGGRFRKIVERNTALPHTKTLSIATTRDGQTELEVVVFQGESDKAQENEYLGTLAIPGLTKRPRGAHEFEIVFFLSAEALLTITAEDKRTGRRIAASFSTRDTPEEVRARLGSAKAEAGTGMLKWFKRLFGREQRV
ncbi:MAG TPA: Hsp70 family protein [Myxococcales bacterium]|nr:Hsp70 family protein [Myxococcales bacterium]